MAGRCQQTPAGGLGFGGGYGAITFWGVKVMDRLFRLLIALPPPVGAGGEAWNALGREWTLGLVARREAGSAGLGASDPGVAEITGAPVAVWSTEALKAGRPGLRGMPRRVRHRSASAMIPSDLRMTYIGS